MDQREQLADLRSKLHALRQHRRQVQQDPYDRHQIRLRLDLLNEEADLQRAIAELEGRTP